VRPDHSGFLAELERGRRVELCVACAFLEAGLSVRMERLDKAQTPYEAARFKEQTDLIIDERWLIEVKSSTYPFSERDDWPFGCVYVCTEKRWQHRKQKPFAFVILSQPTGAMLALTTRNSDSWWTVDSKDSRRNGWVTTTLCAPKSDLYFLEDLVSVLVERAAANGGQPAQMGDAPI
jgi:hypothetical protein